MAHIVPDVRFVPNNQESIEENWFVYHEATGTGREIFLNTTAAEVTNSDSVDPTATGFSVIQVATTNINVSGDTYLFLAIA